MASPPKEALLIQVLVVVRLVDIREAVEERHVVRIDAITY
jgi:hypothetical protein